MSVLNEAAAIYVGDRQVHMGGGQPGYPPGRWFTTGNTAGSTTAQLDRHTFVPFIPEFPVTVDAVAFYINSQVSATATFTMKTNVYSNDPSANVPQSLIGQFADVTVPSSSPIGPVIAEGSVALGRQVYWLGSRFHRTTGITNLNIRAYPPSGLLLAFTNVDDISDPARWGAPAVLAGYFITGVLIDDPTMPTVNASDLQTSAATGIFPIGLLRAA
jgi:hypothetical protein